MPDRIVPDLRIMLDRIVPDLCIMVELLPARGISWSVVAYYMMCGDKINLICVI